MRVAGVIAVVLVVAGIASIVAHLVVREPARHAMRLSLEAPLGVTDMGGPQISPDGRYIAFAALDSTGTTWADSWVWIQSLDGRIARPLPGTKGSQRFFWSPDSRFLAFHARRKLQTIAIAGGEPRTICDGIPWGHGSWGTAGTILLGNDPAIGAVSASGGQLTQVTWGDTSRGESEFSPACPQFLPDGRHFLYLGWIEGRPESTALRLGRLGSRKSKVLDVGVFSRFEYVPPGYVLYQRGRTLLAQPFDPDRLRLAGGAFPVVDDVAQPTSMGDKNFTASATGTLVYRSDSPQATRMSLIWIDRGGRMLGTLGLADNYWKGIALSSDESRVAVSVVAPGEVNPDIWVLDATRGMPVRITSDPGIEILPAWSPDGMTLFYAHSPDGDGWRIRMKPASGIGEERELPLPPGTSWPLGLASDGRSLLAWMAPADGKPDIVMVQLGENPSTTPLGISAGLGVPADGFSVSPDGKWGAYSSNESGRSEVYVVQLPGPTGKWRVSPDGGSDPRWSADGTELFFLAPDMTLRSAAISTLPAFRVARPVRILGAAPRVAGYAPAADGKRFLVMVGEGRSALSHKVVLNWPASVRRR